MNFLLRAARFIKNNFWELYFFWSYAIPAKLRIFKYKSTKIMLIRLDHIGDCVMFSDAAKEIRKTYKDRNITVVCRPVSRPIMESLDIFDKIICFDPVKPNRSRYRNLIREIRRESYDILLQPVMSKMFCIDIISAAVKCNKRVSIEPNDSIIDPRLLKMTKFIYGNFIPYPRGHVSEFDIHATFIRGACNADYKSSLPKLNYGKQDFVGGKYYVLFPGGTIANKMWPPELFAKTAEFIYNKTGMTGVICGLSSEKHIADKLKSNLHSAPCIDLTGKTTLLDVVNVIGNAQLVVSNDTSGVHIAAATNTPSVAIAGGWYYHRFLPYHLENIKPDDKLPLAAHTDMPCYYCNYKMESINPDCWKKLHSGQLLECIDKVSFEQVKELVCEILTDVCLRC